MIGTSNKRNVFIFAIVFIFATFFDGTVTDYVLLIFILIPL